MAPSSSLRRNGVLLVLSTPISGILSYAAIATVIGEEHLEGSDGLSGLGWVASALPLVAGLGLIAWSFTDRRPAPGRPVAVVALAVVLVGLGLVSLLTGEAGDPNIGGPLLVFAGLLTAVVGLAKLRTAAVPGGDGHASDAPDRPPGPSGD